MIALFLCCRITVTLTYSFNNEEHIFSNTDWLAAILLVPIMILLATPAFIMIKQDNNLSVIDRAYGVSKFFGHIISVLYALYFLFIPISSIARFTAFATSTLQPDRSVIFYSLIIMIPVCFAATKGIEPIARASTLAAIFGGIILLAITILLIPRFNLLNVSTPLYQDKENFISIMKILVSNSTETVAFLVIFPQIKGKIQKSYISFSVASGLIICVLLFTVSATLGAYARLQAFPFYTTYGIAEIGSLKRLDAFHSSVWLIGIFIKSLLYTHLSQLCLDRIIGRKFKTLTIIVLSGIITVVSSLLSGKYENFTWIFDASNLLRGLVILSLIIPVLILICSSKKMRSKKYE